jgi:hypothetical protein
MEAIYQYCVTICPYRITIWLYRSGWQQPRWPDSAMPSVIQIAIGTKATLALA